MGIETSFAVQVYGVTVTIPVYIGFDPDQHTGSVKLEKKDGAWYMCGRFVIRHGSECVDRREYRVPFDFGNGNVDMSGALYGKLKAEFPTHIDVV